MLASVLIPVFNGRSTIGRAVGSALAQGPDVEVILTDDGSTDGSAEVLAAMKDPRIRVVVHKTNLGIGAARNTAARAAGSEFLLFLDQDDELLPGAAHRQVENLRSFGPQVGVVAGRVEVIERQGETPARRWPLDDAPAEPTLESLLTTNCIPLGGTIIRSDLFERLDGFDEERRMMGATDYNLWLRSVQLAEIRLMPYATARLYRDRPSYSSSLERMLEARYLAISRLDPAVVDSPTARESLERTASELADLLPLHKSAIWRSRAAMHRSGNRAGR